MFLYELILREGKEFFSTTNRWSDGVLTLIAGGVTGIKHKEKNANHPRIDRLLSFFGCRDCHVGVGVAYRCYQIADPSRLSRQSEISRDAALRTRFLPIGWISGVFPWFLRHRISSAYRQCSYFFRLSKLLDAFQQPSLK